MADQDIQLDLKKRARRRLVGAAALALLAAIVLPLVMDKEPKPVGQEIQIRIPGQETTAPVAAERAASATVPAEGVTPAVSEAAPQATSGVTAAPVAPLGVPAPAAAKTAAAPAVLSREPAKVEPVPPKTVEKPAPKAAEKAAEKPAEKVAAKPRSEVPSEIARAEAILNGGEVADPGHYVVQLGVFSDAVNVKKLRQRVKAAGYNSFSESVDTASGQKTRVRAGPFASKEAAQKARDKLKLSGMDGIVAGK